MAYTRWDKSRWYSYRVHKKCRDWKDEMLVIADYFSFRKPSFLDEEDCIHHRFSATTVVNNMENCLKNVIKMAQRPLDESEQKELRSIFTQFVQELKKDETKDQS